MAGMALTNAERQRRFRERRAAGEPVRTVAVSRTPKDRRPRPKQWTDAVAVLRRLQGEYEALLRAGRAWIVEVYRDGRRIEQPWDARRMSESSSVIRNVRSKKNYRKNIWKRNGIQSLVVSVRRPVTGTR